MRRWFVILSIVIVALIAVLTWLSLGSWWLFGLFLVLIGIGMYDLFQREHAILRNFPIIGHFRYLFEMIRPEISQYFIETDLAGRPFNRLQRSLVYQRAKHEIDTEPFGSQLDFYADGYEWVMHSTFPSKISTLDLRTRFGGPDCKQPYEGSILNVSAMSFGSLSANAVMALNKGQKMETLHKIPEKVV